MDVDLEITSKPPKDNLSLLGFEHGELTHLSEFPRKRIDVRNFLRIRNADGVWPQTYQRTIFSVKIQVLFMRFPRPNPVQARDVRQARIPWSWDVGEADIGANSPEQIDEEAQGNSGSKEGNRRSLRLYRGEN